MRSPLRTIEKLVTAVTGASRRGWLYFANASIVRRCLIVLGVPAILLAIHLHYTFLGENLHCVEKGKLYRSAQLNIAQLEQVIAELHIRTVINLRGCNAGQKWYEEERQLALSAGIEFCDVNTFSANEVPNRRILLRLIHALDKAPKPILLHCRCGADRTGLASAIYLLLRDHDVHTARGQLSLAYGYIFWGRKRRMFYVLDAYENWLQHQQLSHNHKRFRHWAERIYHPPNHLTFQSH